MEQLVQLVVPNPGSAALVLVEGIKIKIRLIHATLCDGPLKQVSF